jgi:hypothetical protein
MQLSELYKLEVRPDEPPQVVILTPKPYTVVDYGEPTTIPLRVKLKDDYGISDAAVMATVSSGKGEAVKFKEQEIRWDQDVHRRSAFLRVIEDVRPEGPGPEARVTSCIFIAGRKTTGDRRAGRRCILFH